MLVTVLAVGSQGDVRPFVAMGKGLIGRGYTVRLASHEVFGDMARANGLEFAPVIGNPLDILNGPEGKAWLESADRPLAFLKSTAAVAGAVFDRLSTSAWTAAQGSDILIYSMPLAITGYSIAEGLGVPGVPAALYPVHPSRAFPSVLTPSLPVRLGIVNWAGAFAVAELFWQIVKSHHDRWRRLRLGLGPLPFLVPFWRHRKQGIPYLYGYSPSVIPIPPRWHSTRVVCGYWFLDRPEEWRPPAELCAFLENGPPPLYVGFGSMLSTDRERLTSIVLKALRKTGQRAVLAAGWGGLAGTDRSNEVFTVDAVPHDWLFPRVSAAVHHGGVGTTAAALRAGTPSIVIPFFADQFSWGMRVREMGVGPDPLPEKRLTAIGLEAAIRATVGNDRVKANCAAMAKKIQGENGIETAAEAFDRYTRGMKRGITR